MELLVDYGKLEPVQIISESKTDGSILIRGIFARAEEFNNNDRRYPKKILEREVTKIQPLINESRLLGALDHPDTMNVSLTAASHLITKLGWQGNVLIGEARLLNTPNGKVAQQLIKDGVKLGVSSRGMGTLKECREFPGKKEVNEDYRMVTFDLVADPSTKGAFPGVVSESTKILLEKTKKEVATQTLILKLFKNKLLEAKSNTIKKLFTLNESTDPRKELKDDAKLATRISKGVKSRGGLSSKKQGKGTMATASKVIKGKAKDPDLVRNLVSQLLKNHKYSKPSDSTDTGKKPKKSKK